MLLSKRFTISTLLLVMLGVVMVGFLINRRINRMENVKWDFTATLSDAQLEGIFNSHREVFEKLVADIKSTDRRLGAFHRDGLGHERLSPLQRQQYCDLLEAAGMSWALVKWERDSHSITIEILPSHRDKDGLIRSLYYSTNSLAPCKENLSRVSQQDIGADKRWFKQIAPQWFIAANNVDFLGE